MNKWTNPNARRKAMALKTAYAEFALYMQNIEEGLIETDYDDTNARAEYTTDWFSYESDNLDNWEH